MVFGWIKDNLLGGNAKKSMRKVAASQTEAGRLMAEQEEKNREFLQRWIQAQYVESSPDRFRSDQATNALMQGLGLPGYERTKSPIDILGEQTIGGHNLYSGGPMAGMGEIPENQRINTRPYYQANNSLAGEIYPGMDIIDAEPMDVPDRSFQGLELPAPEYEAPILETFADSYEDFKGSGYRKALEGTAEDLVRGLGARHSAAGFRPGAYDRELTRYGNALADTYYGQYVNQGIGTTGARNQAALQGYDAERIQYADEIGTMLQNYGLRASEYENYLGQLFQLSGGGDFSGPMAGYVEGIIGSNRAGANALASATVGSAESKAQGEIAKSAITSDFVMAVLSAMSGMPLGSGNKTTGGTTGTGGQSSLSNNPFAFKPDWAYSRG